MVANVDNLKNHQVAHIQNKSWRCSLQCSLKPHKKNKNKNKGILDEPSQHVLQKGWPQAADLILSRGKVSKQIPQVSCQEYKHHITRDSLTSEYREGNQAHYLHSLLL